MCSLVFYVLLCDPIAIAVICDFPQSQIYSSLLLLYGHERRELVMGTVTY